VQKFTCRLFGLLQADAVSVDVDIVVVRGNLVALFVAQAAVASWTRLAQPMLSQTLHHCILQSTHSHDCTCAVRLCPAAGWLVAPDSVFVLVMLIQNSVPTALNVHTLATLNGNREEEVGALLFWQ
jgi:hypothetical protein